MCKVPRVTPDEGIAIVVPVLNRPHRVEPLLRSIKEAASVPYRVVFVVSPDDHVERNTILSVLPSFPKERIRIIDVPWRPGPGDYAKKTNLGYRLTTEPYLFTGADDLEFHPFWDRNALDKFTDGIGVVGTNDLGNPKVLQGIHSTHSLVSRAYADNFGTIDGPGKIYSECYHHLFVDDEFIQTAMHRSAYAHAHDSIVEHIHPHLLDEHRRPKAPTDSTYKKGAKHVAADRRIFRSRQHLWGGTVTGKTANIDVVIATYGDESWKATAERALRSVHNQRVPPRSISVVHGESLAAARNEGASRGAAAYVSFLDADDELHPTYFQAMSRVLNRGYGILNPSVQFAYPDGRRVKKNFQVRPLDKGNYIVIGAPLRRDLFEEAGGFDEQWRAYEDWQLMRKINALGGRILRVPNAIYIAYWHEDSRNNTVHDKEQLMEEMRAEFDEWNRSR